MPTEQRGRSTLAMATGAPSVPLMALLAEACTLASSRGPWCVGLDE